jgi:acetoin utilization deacetylase AcuC-like enzyme
VRPPGHHALPDRAGGVCILHNLAITARYAVTSQGFRRVLIVDWDIHHGNGIQEVFYKESEVFYFSTHDVLLYPYTGHGRETGEGAGLGYNLNIPLPRQAKDPDVAHLYREVLTRLSKRLKPDLILVSAGFDGHRRDPIGRSLWTEDVFKQLTRCLLYVGKKIAQVPVLFVLEGGYEPISLANCVHGVIKELLDGNPDIEPPDHRSRLAEKLIDKARTRHASFGVWTD